MLKHLDDTNFEKEVLEVKGKPVLVDFFATWCGPCQMLGPVLEKIGGEREDFDIAKVDIDQAQKLTIKYGIESVPTLLIFKDGKVLSQKEGYHTEKEVLEMMSKYVEE